MPLNDDTCDSVDRDSPKALRKIVNEASCVPLRIAFLHSCNVTGTTPVRGRVSHHISISDFDV